MTDAAARDLLADAASLLRTVQLNGDVACDVVLSLDGTAGSFGDSSDGLNVINTAAAIDRVLGQGCGRFKVVDVINYCGGFGTNIIGCGNTPGNGIAVVHGAAGPVGAAGCGWVRHRP
jgi:hypothetical protein